MRLRCLLRGFHGAKDLIFVTKTKNGFVRHEFKTSSSRVSGLRSGTAVSRSSLKLSTPAPEELPMPIALVLKAALPFPLIT